jgi:Holliday junction DNA helicase RuvA
LPELDASVVSISSVSNPVQLANSPKQEAVSALCALGYKPQDAAKMVQGIAVEDKSCEDIIRMALRGTIK